MRTQWFRTGALWIGAAALALSTVATANAQDKNKAKEDNAAKNPLVLTGEVELAVDGKAKGLSLGKRKIIVRDGDTQLKADHLLLNAGKGQGAWFIGVVCHPADTTLRVQLGLGDAPALVVDSVDATSPAGKAGVKQHDLIVEAGGNKVGQLADLSAAVQNVKGGKLTLKLIRGGKKQTVGVTPVKRKSFVVVWQKIKLTPNEALQGSWLDKLWKQSSTMPKGNLQFRAVHPFGVIDVHKMPPFPKNLQVRIEKNGDAPAKIIVKRDGVQWETTEDKLDKLPEDVRGYVKQLLGKTDFSGLGMMEGFPALPPRTSVAPQRPPIAPRANMQIAPFRLPPSVESTAAGKRLEKQLEAMNQRLEKLHKAIERLQQPKGESKPKAE